MAAKTFLIGHLFVTLFAEPGAAQEVQLNLGDQQCRMPLTEFIDGFLPVATEAFERTIVRSPENARHKKEPVV